MSWLAFLVVVALPTVSSAGMVSAINLINGSGQTMDSALSQAGDSFTTNFLGTNDVTIKLLAVGNYSTPFTQSLNYTASPGINPS